MTEDKIGRTEIVDKICSLVDNLQKDKHFCLALNGDWGSGKTFVMQIIEEKLKTHAEYTVIKYDAWENNFYSDPLISILSCVIDGVQNKLSEIQGGLTVGKEIFKQVKDAALEDNGKIGVFTRAIKGIADLVKLFNKPFTKDTDGKNISGFKSYQSLLKEVKDKLNLITEYEEYRDKQNKLIILVDEIDRCLPDEQLKILERLHHLFDVKNCAVICAINKGCISKNVNTTYGIDGNEYLRKFFDVNYELKMFNVLFLQNLLTKDLLEQLEKFCKIYDLQNQFKIDGLNKSTFNICFQIITNKIINSNLQLDNREIERYYDSVNNVLYRFGYQNLNSYHLFFIVVGIFIKRFIYSVFLEDTGKEHISYLANLMNISGRYDDFHKITLYHQDYYEVYLTFDEMANDLTIRGESNRVMEGKPFLGDTKLLKKLMIIYGGNNDTNQNER